MLTIDIPGGSTLQISTLVLDFNGTIALDGELISGVPERLARLAGMLQVHVLTADTHGTVTEKLAGLACTLSIIPADNQEQAKLAYIKNLDSQKTVAIGNGRNDLLMLREAALGIAVIGREGACAAALLAADLFTVDIQDSLDLLLHPGRLQATLRN